MGFIRGGAATEKTGMGLFTRNRTFYEPVLGHWVRRGGVWVASYELPGHAEEVEVEVCGSKTEPDPEALQLAIELPVQYVGLVEPIRAALFEHYEPYREAFELGDLPVDEIPMLEGSDEVWPHVALEGVAIVAMEDGLMAEVRYETAWDIEHRVGARIYRRKGAWVLDELCGSC